MSTVITEECINCGACEPECPNTAIYQGDVGWELDGQKHPPIASSIFYIVPQKCTECVGFYDHEACAAVCPVDCCVPDPNIPETEDVLIERAKKLHPDQDFAAGFPSRFRKDGAGGAVAASPVAAAAPPPPVVAAPPAAAAPAVAMSAPAPPPEAALRPAAETPSVAPATVPPVATAKPEPATPKPVEAAGPKVFPGELRDDFETLLQERGDFRSEGGGWLGKVAIALVQPLAGALPHGTKQALETAICDRRVFSNAAATGLNILLNMILYPVIFVIMAWALRDGEIFSAQMNWYIFLGMGIAGAESIWRLREGFFAARPIDRIRFGAALYGLPLAFVVGPIARRAARRREQVHQVGFDGFYGGNFDDKLERGRRYGDVYRLEDRGGAYWLQFEFPRLLPPTGLKERLGLPDAMPDYDYDLSLTNGSLIVRGRIVDPRVKKLTAVAAAFPPEFMTRVDLENRVCGFRHRYRDKVLEVVLPKA